VLRLRARDQAVIETYALHGRITPTGPEDAVECAVAHWQAARAEGKQALLLASDHQMVDALNDAVRAARVRAGEVEQRGTLCRGQQVGMGDEVVTLRNDRHLRTSSGEWVRNGERWSVVERGEKALLLSHAEGRGELWVPMSYASKHLGLAYGLTVHKGQGSTVDRAVVVVDQKMTAQQLYVGMSRGKEHNQAVVVCEAPDTGHGRFHTPSAPEVLSRVLRHSGAEASATDTIRHVFEEAQDPRLAEALVEQAEATLERLAGKDLSKEIAELAPHVDVAGARQKVLEAQERSRQAASHRVELEQEASSWKRHLPGVKLVPESQLRMARNWESNAQHDYERIRHELYETEQARAELDLLEERQAQRERWLEAHPQYVETVDWRRRELQQVREFQSERAKNEVVAHCATSRAEAPGRADVREIGALIAEDEVIVDLEADLDCGPSIAHSHRQRVTQSVNRRRRYSGSAARRGFGRSR
jgi:hypothetical protein